MAKAFISDGYTLKGEFDYAGEKICFTYRQAAPERTTAYQAEPRANAKEWMKSAVKLLREHVKDWNLQEDDGTTSEPTEANLARVPKVILEQMIDRVTAYTPAEARTDVKN